MSELPSFDHRYGSAKGDITQHRVWAHDWEPYWVFDDRRFDLHHCSDETFLRFLCEMIHPAVRPNREETELLLQMFNKELAEEGYKLVETKTKFGKSRFEPLGLVSSTVEAVEQMKDEAQSINSEYIQREIVRMTSAIEKDPALAIGTAKEFVETVCKTILTERKRLFKGDEDLPKLVYLTMQEVAPLKEFKEFDEASQIVKKMLGALSVLAQCLAELRNSHGTGHGKGAEAPTPLAVHATLAVNSAATVALFLFQSREKKRSS